jgi:hypothetical protein
MRDEADMRRRANIALISMKKDGEDLRFRIGSFNDIRLRQDRLY